MQRLAVVCVALLGLLAAVAHASTLRSELQQLLQANLEADRQPRRCRPEESRRKKRRDGRSLECENTSEIKPGCTCKAVCHIWGDPHVSPFFSQCSIYTMDTANVEYEIWTLPGGNGNTDGEDEGVKVTGKVSAVKGRKWVTELRVNGDLIHDVSKCNTPYEYVEFTQELFSDSAASTRSKVPDVKLKVGSLCERRHGVNHLNITVTLEDAGFGTGDDQDDGGSDDFASRSARTIPVSTNFFNYDFGVCTDPGKFGEASPDAVRDNVLTCKRISKVKGAEGIDGRQCTCNTQCAMFGDPYVLSFFKEQTGNEGDRNKNKFKIPLREDITKQYQRTMYSFHDLFAIDVAIDECEHVSSARVLILKPELATRVCDSVGPKAGTAQQVRPESDYENYTFSAEELCKNFDVEDRDVFKFPNPAYPRVYDARVDGFPIGSFAEVKGETPGDATRLLRLSSDENVKQCPIKLETVERIVAFGGIQAMFKCHRTIGGKPYFNICVERKGVAADEFTNSNRKNTDFRVSRSAAATAFKAPIAQKDDPFEILSEIEKLGQTSGWCVLGDEKGPIGRGETFEFRSGLNNIAHFPIVFSPDI